jgi:transposase
MGRPAYPAEQMFRMLFLEYYYNHSDVEISEMCRYNALYKYFVGLKIDGEIPDDTSLVVFRKRLGAERFERIFNAMVRKCGEAGLLEGRRKIVDASKIVAAP